MRVICVMMSLVLRRGLSVVIRICVSIVREIVIVFLILKERM